MPTLSSRDRSSRAVRFPIVSSARAIALAATLSLPVALRAQEPVDTAAIARIRAESFDRSQIMDVVSWLTDVHGPRLTGSPTTRKAADWAMKTMSGWGLQNVKLESWGPFGRGWTNDRLVAQVIEPVPFNAIAYATAWTPGTNGPVRADVVLAVIDSEADFAKYRGKLRGKIVMINAPREVKAHFETLGTRQSDSALARMAGEPIPTPRAPGAGGGRNNFAAAQAFVPKRTQFLADEGAVAILTEGRGDGGTVFVQSAGGSRDATKPVPLPIVVMAVEHYGRMARALMKGVPVKMDLDVKNSWYDADQNSFNIVAEIPGTDKNLKDEVVMIGGHFDSWQGGTGATDNAAGSAVMMEAMRLIKASGLKPKRTIRIALWTGEEEGLLGSRAYVKDHFGDPATMVLKPEQAKLAAYFNVDNGTGAIRGVYAQSNPLVAPIFAAWMAPFKDKGVNTVTLLNTGSTDHAAFDAIGIPGFQFIQDPIEYSTRTHHSNMDTYERIQADDMKLNAAVVAAFAYQAANRAEKLPRKPLPTATSATRQ